MRSEPTLVAWERPPLGSWISKSLLSNRSTRFAMGRLQVMLRLVLGIFRAAVPILPFDFSDGHAVVGVPSAFPVLLSCCMIDIALPSGDRLLGVPVADGDPYAVIAANALHGDKAGLCMS